MELLQDDSPVFIDKDSYMHPCDGHYSYKPHESNLYYYTMVPDVVLQEIAFYKLKIKDAFSNKYYILNMGYGYQLLERACSNSHNIDCIQEYLSLINTSYKLYFYDDSLYCIRLWLNPCVFESNNQYVNSL